MSSSTPHVRVLLAAYNGRDWLDEQLTGILGQSHVSVDVVVSVDRSSDDTEDIVDSWVARDSRVTRLPHGQKFGGAAKNFYRLMREAGGGEADFYALADQDDVWLPEKLSRAVASLVSHEAEAYSSNVLTWSAGGPARMLRKSHPQRRWDYLFSSAGPGCTYVVRGSLMRTFSEWLTQNPASDEVAYHDWLLYAWARTHGVSWFIDDQAHMLYRQHDSNQIGANRGVSAARHRAARFLDDWYFDQVTLIADVIGDPAEPVLELRGNRAARIRVLCRSRHLRRAPKDVTALTMMLALNVVRGRSS